MKLIRIKIKDMIRLRIYPKILLGRLNCSRELVILENICVGIPNFWILYINSVKGYFYQALLKPGLATMHFAPKLNSSSVNNLNKY